MSSSAYGIRRAGTPATAVIPAKRHYTECNACEKCRCGGVTGGVIVLQIQRQHRPATSPDLACKLIAQMQHEKRIANQNAKRPSVQDRDHDGLIVAAWQQGWWCEQGKKHVKCFPPDPSKNAVIVPSTPSDYRSFKNVRSRMRLSGLTI